MSCELSLLSDSVPFNTHYAIYVLYIILYTVFLINGTGYK